jgi:hypothetical protein
MRPQTEVMLAKYPKTVPADLDPADMNERREKATPTRTQ